MLHLRTYTAPAEEPVSLAEMKLHLRVDHTEEDALIASLITAAREQCELESRRTFCTTTLEQRLEGWPWSGGFALLRGPVQSITAISYTDEDGNAGTVDSGDYVLYTETDPATVVLAPDAEWPTVDLMPGHSVAIRYVAGYGTAGAVPQRYKAAIKLLAAHWYENREPVIVGTVAVMLPMAVRALLDTDRGGWF